MARRSADPESCTRSSAGLRRSDRFLIGLHEAERVVFVSHINPDPDSLGSMLGLAHLVETRLGKTTRSSPATGSSAGPRTGRWSMSSTSTSCRSRRWTGGRTTRW